MKLSSPFYLLALMALRAGSVAAVDDAPSRPAPPPETPAKAEQPDLFGGSVGKRAALTGNWGGTRNSMAQKGIIVSADWITVFQNQASGGANSNSLLRRTQGKDEDDAELMGFGDLAVMIDMNKTGLWKNGIFKIRAEFRAGDSLNFRSGSITPVNTLGSEPLDEFDEEIGDLTEFSYTHFITPKFALTGGLLNTLEADQTPLAGNGRAKTDFLNMDFKASPAALFTAPYKTIGGGLVALPHRRIVFTASVLNHADLSGKSPLGHNLHGLNIGTELYVSHSIGCLPGGQLFGYSASWDKYKDLNVNLAEIINDTISVRPPIIPAGDILKEKNFSNAGYYNFWQYFQTYEGDAKEWSPLNPTTRPKGWGIFARTALSDGNPNPIRWNASGGLAGDNPARKVDFWGVGAFHKHLTNELLIKQARLGNESGLEAFYNAQITPWFHITADIQYIDTGLPRASNGFIVGLRTKLDF